MGFISEEMARGGLPMQRSGNGHCSPCPTCGGRDRFYVTYKANREFYKCRQCGAHGDAIQFLRSFRGFCFADAKAEVERYQREKGPAQSPSDNIDRDAWERAAARLLAEAQQNLRDSPAAQEALLKSRGITPESAARYGLGYLPEGRAFSRSAFGLPEVSPRADSFFVDAGLVIAVRTGGRATGIMFRRDTPYNGESYHTLPGSRLFPWVDVGKYWWIVFVVESYLCGMLFAQETQHRYTTVALGSASKRNFGEAEALLREADVIFVALDSDDAGAKQAWTFWETNFPQAVRCVIPKRFGKDPTDACRAGMKLADWAAAGLRLAQKRGLILSTTHAPQTEDAAPTERCGTTVHRVANSDEAVRACAQIAAECQAVGMALEYENGERGGLIRVALYAKAMASVYVVEMAEIAPAALDALGAIQLVTHDGVALQQRLPGLSKAKIACTLLMANAVLNECFGFEDALARFGVQRPAPCGLPEVAVRAIALANLHRALSARLDENKAKAVYFIMRDAQPAVASMAAVGIHFDSSAHARLCAEWTTELASAAAKLPPGMDPASPKTVREWLPTVVPANAIAEWERTSTGEISTADADLAAWDHLPEVHALREHRRVAKLLSTYGARFASFADPQTGRLRADWQLAGAGTGRMTCRTPNLLGLPRDEMFRALFSSPTGRRLLVADASQFQLRIAAHLAGDTAMLSVYAGGGDLHTATAANLTGTDSADVTKEERRLAKAANFGLLFGQGTTGFRGYAASKYGVELSLADAEATRRAWLHRFQGIAAWHRATASALKSGSPITTAARRVAQPKDLTGNALHQALAFQVQGTEAEIMLRAITAIHRGLDPLRARLVLFVHDEVIVEVDDCPSVLSEASELIQRALADAMLSFFPDAATADLSKVEIVENWAEAQ